MTLKQKIGKCLVAVLPFNQRTIDILRFELNAMITHLLNYISPSIRRTRARLRTQKAISLNIGSGGRGSSDWVNIDIMRNHEDVTFPYDIRRGIPFEDGQVIRILAEHVVEHIEFKHDIPNLFREFYRVLQPGGNLRIIVPDGERWLAAYVSKDPAQWAALDFPKLPDDMPTPMCLINHVFHQSGEHFFCYDFETMAYMLKQAGFTKVSKMGYHQTNDPLLALDRIEHAKYSLYVEAQK